MPKTNREIAVAITTQGPPFTRIIDALDAKDREREQAVAKARRETAEACASVYNVESADCGLPVSMALGKLILACGNPPEPEVPEVTTNNPPYPAEAVKRLQVEKYISRHAYTKVGYDVLALIAYAEHWHSVERELDETIKRVEAADQERTSQVY